MDQRDQLVDELGKLVDVKVLAQDSGKYNVFIGNGQSLVLGDRAVVKAATRRHPTRTAIVVGSTARLPSSPTACSAAARSAG